MAALTIRNIDEELKRGLRLRAAANDRSMEEEVRTILREALRSGDRGRADMFAEVRRLVDVYGAADDLKLLPDEPAEPMTFE